MLSAHVVFRSAAWTVLHEHFQAATPREEGAFILFASARGRRTTRLLVAEVILPPADGWEVKGHDALKPSARWFSSVISAAIAGGYGVGFIHSHPGSDHPPVLSPIDRRTSLDWSVFVLSQLSAPFASLVWSPAGITGLLFDSKHEPTEDISVVAVGDGRLASLSPIADVAEDGDLDDRQRRALSRLGHLRTRHLRVGVVGAGGTGSPVIEQLVRLGVDEVVVIDPDRLDAPSNLRRVVGSRWDDLYRQRPKVAIAARHARALRLGSRITPIAEDVRTLVAARALIDCDAIVVTTDTHSSRAFVNQLAYQCWVPMIDVGLRIGTSLAGDITGMPVEVRTLLPDNGCLWCRGVLDPYRIRAEILPLDERTRLAAEGYVQGVDQPVPSLTPVNTVAAGVSTLALLRLVVGDGVKFDQMIIDSWEGYLYARDNAIDPNCVCAQWRGRGDDRNLPFLRVSA